MADATTLEDASVMLRESNPDVVIIDPWRAVDVSDIVTRLQKDVKAPIVIFTSDGGGFLSESLKAGVKGYVTKDSPSEDLVRAVEARQDRGLLRRFPAYRHDRARRGRPDAQRAAARDPPDAGRRDADRAVADKLGLSTETVRTHTKRILAKLEASTRARRPWRSGTMGLSSSRWSPGLCFFGHFGAVWRGR